MASSAIDFFDKSLYSFVCQFLIYQVETMIFVVPFVFFHFLSHCNPLRVRSYYLQRVCTEPKISNSEYNSWLWVAFVFKLTFSSRCLERFFFFFSDGNQCKSPPCQFSSSCYVLAFIKDKPGSWALHQFSSGFPQIPTPSKQWIN